MIEDRDFKELIRLVQSTVHNFDQHLKDDHKQKSTGKGDNLRFYLQNIEKFCSHLLGKYSDRQRKGEEKP